MIRLALGDDSPRNQHVAKVVCQSMKRVTIKDLRRFPAELMANFPDPPPLVVDIFARGQRTRPSSSRAGSRSTKRTARRRAGSCGRWRGGCICRSSAGFRLMTGGRQRRRR
jgi:hypothetical protein